MPADGTRAAAIAQEFGMSCWQLWNIKCEFTLFAKSATGELRYHASTEVGRNALAGPLVDFDCLPSPITYGTNLWKHPNPSMQDDMLGRTMHRQILLLATAQALFQTASVLVMTVGGLAGSQISQVASLATLPIATMFLGTATITFPASLWMTRVGRRTGFVAGALLGAVGGLIGAAGLWLQSLMVLSAGTFMVGAY